MIPADKIRQLYNISATENFGFSEAEIMELEHRLDIKLPLQLRSYYLTLGKAGDVNYSYNRLLKPGKEIGFSQDRYLIFYEENQAVAFWGIKEEDLTADNPPVWGNYGTEADPDWHKETDATDTFFLLMAVYNGTFGGLRYHANYFGQVAPELVAAIEKRWSYVPAISRDNQKVYTDNFHEVLSLSFDAHATCTAIFIGTSDQQRFDNILDSLEINWSYLSYEDEDDEEEE